VILHPPPFPLPFHRKMSHGGKKKDLALFMVGQVPGAGLRFNEKQPIAPFFQALPTRMIQGQVILQKPQNLHTGETIGTLRSDSLDSPAAAFLPSGSWGLIRELGVVDLHFEAKVGEDSFQGDGRTNR
jgi:hypothetical protein